MTGDARNLFLDAGLVPTGPYRWGEAVSPDAPGVYVVETPTMYSVAPVDVGLVEAWIDRVPTLRVDGERPTADEVVSRLSEFWLHDERVVYVGLAGTSVRRRVRSFTRTPLGDPRPHAGGHWIKTLERIEDLLVWTASTDEPGRYEEELLEAFGRRNMVTESRSVDPVLPFANRQSARGVRKVHGISGSTLPRDPAGPSRFRVAPIEVRTRTVPSGRESDINHALQAFVCSRPSRRVTAVEAAAELDRTGVLSDSSQRPGLPLRKLLRAGRIGGASQENGRWWYIECLDRQA